MEDALFHQYENEYCNKSTDILRKLSVIATLTAELQQKKISELEADIQEADAAIHRMELEAHSLAPDKSKQLQVKLKGYKISHASMKEQLKKAKLTMSTGDAARAELGLTDDYYSSAAGQRERMLAAKEKLSKTSEALRMGKQQLAEAQEHGAAALAELLRQREVIQHAKATLERASADAKQGNKIATNMAKRWF